VKFSAGAEFAALSQALHTNGYSVVLGVATLESPVRFLLRRHITGRLVGPLSIPECWKLIDAVVRGAS
jgi:hypothetical protein